MEVLVDAWPDYQTVITRPQEEVRAEAAEDQASHIQDVQCDNDRAEVGGWGEEPWHPRFI